MEAIRDSIFSIFKLGPGPSSSHTIGPMRAAVQFRQTCAKFPAARAIRVQLYGSLSSTGQGHGTHTAVLAGLLGYAPDHCPPDLLETLRDNPHQVQEFQIGSLQFPLKLSDINFAGDLPDAPHPNTLDFELLNASGEVIFTQRCCSIGGGEIRFAGAAPELNFELPQWCYHSLRTFRKLAQNRGISPVEILYQNEAQLFHCTRAEIDAHLDRILEVMDQAVTRGITTSGLLPGELQISRRAAEMYRQAHLPEADALERDLMLLNSYALAVSEENAAGHLIVTAPTSGSCGVLPGVIRFLKEKYQLTPQQMREGLLIAALFGLVTRHNASLSGAEVGCQGEVGVASAMAAAFAAHVHGLEFKAVENAAEIALEHHLGMTCDPIGGYVQIPCIERNAVGAVTAVNAAILTPLNPNQHKLDFDAVVDVMYETGQDMNRRYKETAEGGLAHCPLRCAFHC